LTEPIVALYEALQAAGITVRFASAPEAGPGVVIDIPDMRWVNNYRTGCGDPVMAEITTNIWIVGHGHHDDQRLHMEALTWQVWQAVPPPWRIRTINHDRSTADQYVREIQVEL
jgi:hypothetical protein